MRKIFKIRRKNMSWTNLNGFTVKVCLLNYLGFLIVGANNTTVTNSEKGIIYADTARNLSVEPIVAESHADLQLNVSWLPPNDIESVKTYSLEVIPKSSNSDCYSKHCDAYDINPVDTWILIPASIPKTQGVECSIKPYCTYEVVLKSHPSNRSNKIINEITLPECVQNVCYCDPSKLPRPIVDVKLKANTVNISWQLSNETSAFKNNSNFSHYKIAFREKGVFFDDYISETNYTGIEPQSFEIKVPNPKKSTYRVSVSLVSKKHCNGPRGERNFTFKQQDEVEKKVKHNIFSTFHIIILALIIFGLLMFMIVMMTKIKTFGSTPCCVKLWLARARADQNLRTQPGWPHGLRCASDSNRQILEQRCPLYVEEHEKELEDAINRGDVDVFEISPNRLEYIKIKGEGAFGLVYEAMMTKPGQIGQQIVAVKKLKDHATSYEAEGFLKEIAMLKHVGRHEHVVALVGCCTLKQPYCAILEFAEKGDLLKHLIKLRNAYQHNTSGLSNASTSTVEPLKTPHTRPSVADTEYTLLGSEDGRPIRLIPNVMDASIQETRPFILTMKGDLISESTGTSIDSDAFGSSLMLSDTQSQPILSPEKILDPKVLNSYALQIARGMEHLEKKGITHRDLAARNVLIDAKGSLKVSDLGLSRTGIYVTNNQEKVPLRWVAIESIRSSYYSNKSDVWSYAVVLWEIGNLGAFPYPNLENYQILPYLSEGKRLDKPTIVSKELYATMIRCWTEKPEHRPSFAELVKLLQVDESKNKCYIDISTIQSPVSFPPMETDKYIKTLTYVKN